MQEGGWEGGLLPVHCLHRTHWVTQGPSDGLLEWDVKPCVTEVGQPDPFLATMLGLSGLGVHRWTTERTDSRGNHGVRLAIWEASFLLKYLLHAEL